MGVDSIGICLTEITDPFLIIELVEKELKKLVCDSSKDGDCYIRTVNKNLKIFEPIRLPIKKDNSLIVSDKYSAENQRPTMVIFDFKYNGEDRSVFFHFGLTDYSNTFDNNPRLMWTIGCWGKNEEIMKSIASSLEKLGPTYLLMNDSDGSRFVEFISNRLNLLEKKTILI